MTTEYDGLMNYLKVNKLLDSPRVTILDNEIIYYRKLTKSILYLVVARKGDDCTWSWECKKHIVNSLKRYDGYMICTTIDSNIKAMTNLLVSKGFKMFNNLEFYRV